MIIPISFFKIYFFLRQSSMSLPTIRTSFPGIGGVTLIFVRGKSPRKRLQPDVCVAFYCSRTAALLYWSPTHRAILFGVEPFVNAPTMIEMVTRKNAYKFAGFERFHTNRTRIWLCPVSGERNLFDSPGGAPLRGVPFRTNPVQYFEYQPSAQEKGAAYDHSIHKSVPC